MLQDSFNSMSTVHSDFDVVDTVKLEDTVNSEYFPLEESGDQDNNGCVKAGEEREMGDDAVSNASTFLPVSPVFGNSTLKWQNNLTYNVAGGSAPRHPGRLRRKDEVGGSAPKPPAASPQE